MKPLTFVAVSFSAILFVPLSAWAADALAVKVIQASNYSSAMVHFVLDGDETCDSKHGVDCLFSSDCSEPVHGICVKSNAELGAHKLEAFVNGQHLVAWVNVTNPAPGVMTGGVGQCSVQEEDDALTLSCL